MFHQNAKTANGILVVFNGCTMQRDGNNHYLYCEGRKKLFSYMWEYINNQVKL